MEEVKAWDWSKNENLIWEKPSLESYYYVNLWKAKNYQNILDLGCGIGRHTKLFCENGFKVWGCDLSEVAVSNTMQKLKLASLDAKVEVADMHNLPYEDEKFDAIFSYHTISHTTSLKIKTIIKEITRVLKKKGEIFLTLCSKSTYSFQSNLYPHLDENTLIKTDEGPEKGIPHFYVDLEDIKDLFSDFQIINIRHIDDITLSDNDKHSFHYFMHLKKLN